MATPANVRRHFLPWDEPLLPQAVKFLAGDWAGGTPLDLSALVVVVPTKQAGRRLREALAVHAHGRQQAVFPPRVMTPDRLLSDGAGAPVATPLLSLLAWVEVFGDLPLDAYREVFPVDPPAKNFAWPLRLARELAGLQGKLAEGGWQLADVAQRGGDFPETARWEQLGALERLHAARLRRLGLRDGQAAKIAAARQPEKPAGVTKIVLLAVPDPLPLAVRALAGLAETVPVEVVVFAPATEAQNFDDWGRPLTSAWEQRVLAITDFEARVHLCADPSAQAERMARLVAGYGSPEGRLAVGVADAEVLPPLAGALRRVGQAVYNPEGRAYRHEGLYHLLKALAALVQEPTYEAVEALARCPDFLAYLRGRFGAGFSAARWLAGLDDLRAEHLPATLAAAGGLAEAAKDYPERVRGLAVMEELRARLTQGGLAEGVTAVLAEIFSGRKLDPQGKPDQRFEAAAVAWMETVREGAEAARQFPGLTRADWWELALRMFGDGSWAEEKPAGAVELQGWLELPWEEAPHLVIGGMNDGAVPESVAGDPFLPESLRGRLGLKTNAARLARDVYLLQALAASRGQGGQLDLLFGKVSAVGEPLRPSRLLLRCADAELPARVRWLFREPEPEHNPVAWRRAWRLTPPRSAAPDRVSVTSLKRWLKCPLRFYFQQVLKLQAVDAAKSEMDAFDFGTLCHAALEAMGRDPAMRACTDAAGLRDFLRAEFDRAVRRKFGQELTLPLLVQVESARQRLAKAAEVQARECEGGWVIVEVERPFTIAVGGLTVSGKIDRIERHAATGAVRVIDYKTSDTAVSPAAAHLRNRVKTETAPAWAQCGAGDKVKIWTDLQLPLYLEALAPEFGREVKGGYFNLPKAAGETRLSLWEDYPPALRDSAWGCAEGLCAAIRAGEFWPPRELQGREAEWDEWGALFHQGAAASITWPAEVRA